jgi:hypothetical protein
MGSLPFPWGRLFGGLAVLSLTVLNVASCGGVLQFKGLDFALNRPPAAMEKMLKERGGSMKEMFDFGSKSPGATPTPAPARGGPTGDGTLFPPEKFWLVIAYNGAIAFGLLGLLVPQTFITCVGCGAAGFWALLTFWLGFLNAVGEGRAMMQMEIGMFLGYGSFLGLIVVGFVLRAGASAPAFPVGPTTNAWPPPPQQQLPPQPYPPQQPPPPQTPRG